MTRRIYTPKPALGIDDMPLWEKRLMQCVMVAAGLFLVAWFAVSVMAVAGG